MPPPQSWFPLRRQQRKENPQTKKRVKGGKIDVITEKPIQGEESIDATDLVAPGFIDGHQHCLEPYAYRSMVRDGRTTVMDLEVGAFGEIRGR